MGAEKSFLETLEVATPCSASWADMRGDERVRFCGQCQLNVYNLSGMTRAQAEGLVHGAEGRVCIRLLRRTDGTVITSDCPIGVRIARGFKRTLLWAGAALAATVEIAAAFAGLERKPRPVPPPTRPQVVMGACPPIMGKVAIRPAPQPPRTRTPTTPTTGQGEDDDR